jgi:hypothetical protein
LEEVVNSESQEEKPLLSCLIEGSNIQNRSETLE